MWIFPLLRRIERSQPGAPDPSTWKTDTLGVAYVVVAFAFLLPNAAGLILSATSFIPLVPAVRVIATVNAAAGNPEGVNDRYSVANIATIFGSGRRIRPLSPTCVMICRALRFHGRERTPMSARNLTRQGS